MQATASEQIKVGGIQPPPAQILRFNADSSAYPVWLTDRSVARSFTMAGTSGYFFSTVYRDDGKQDAIG